MYLNLHLQMKKLYAYNVGSVLRVYLTFLVTNCSGERSFYKFKMLEKTKEHH